MAFTALLCVAAMNGLGVELLKNGDFAKVQKNGAPAEWQLNLSDAARSFIRVETTNDVVRCAVAKDAPNGTGSWLVQEVPVREQERYNIQVAACVTVENPQAEYSAAVLVLSNNTFRYEAKYEDEQASIKRNPYFLGAYPTRFDIEGDLTFRDYRVLGASSGVSWAYVKTGVGTLVFELGDCGVNGGKSILGQFKDDPEQSRGSNAINEKPMGRFEPPGNGMISNWNGLGHLNVYEGMLVLRGTGAVRNPAACSRHTLIGGPGFFARATPELRIENLGIALGGGGYHLYVGRSIMTNSANPKLTLVNSYLSEDGVLIGRHSEAAWLDAMATYYPVLTMTNSTLVVGNNFLCNRPNNEGHATVSLHDHSLIDVRGGGTTQFFNAEVCLDGGSRFLKSTHKDYVIMRYYDGNAKFTVKNGSVFDVWYWIMWSNIDKACGYEFDGGILNVGSNNTWSATKYADKQGFVVGDNGMTVNVTNTFVHTMTVPFRGDGEILKTGGGVCVFTNAYNVESDNAKPPQYRPTAQKTLLNAGGLSVREGVAVVHPSTVTEDYSITVEDGAALSLGGGELSLAALSGGGIVSNGTISATMPMTANGEGILTFTDVRFGGMFVDLGIAETEKRPPLGQKYTVAHLGDGTSLMGTWKGVNVGEGGKLTFKVENGDVVATVESIGGMVIILR